MVLSGEGADEIFGGYLYFHKAPSSNASYIISSYSLVSKYLALTGVGVSINMSPNGKIKSRGHQLYHPFVFQPCPMS